MKKTLIYILFVVSIQTQVLAQTELFKGWNSAVEVFNKISAIQSSAALKSFSLSTYNGKDDIYNLLTNRLVQKANSFRITNEVVVSQIQPVKSEFNRNGFYVTFKIKQYISGASSKVCRNSEYEYTRKLYIHPEVNFAAKRVVLKPSFDRVRMDAEACFSPGKKYVSGVRNFKNKFKAKVRELENYYLNQFRTTVNLNTE